MQNIGKRFLQSHSLVEVITMHRLSKGYNRRRICCMSSKHLFNIIESTPICRRHHIVLTLYQFRDLRYALENWQWFLSKKTTIAWGDCQWSTCKQPLTSTICHSVSDKSWSCRALQESSSIAHIILTDPLFASKDFNMPYFDCHRVRTNCVGRTGSTEKSVHSSNYTNRKQVKPGIIKKNTWRSSLLDRLAICDRGCSKNWLSKPRWKLWWRSERKWDSQGQHWPWDRVHDQSIESHGYRSVVLPSSRPHHDHESEPQHQDAENQERTVKKKASKAKAGCDHTQMSLARNTCLIHSPDFRQCGGQCKVRCPTKHAAVASRERTNEQ